MKWPLKVLLALALVLSGTTGCGRFVAHRMVQAPNTYPGWLGPTARVSVVYDDNAFTNFPPRTVEVGPPAAQLFYRVVEPRDFHLEIASTNWLQRGKLHSRFSFQTHLPDATNAWTQSPRGTVVLLHGYGLSQFAMAPWALRLAEDGWRCVLVDLRGHGKSTGRRIYYGVHETKDLSQLLDALAHDGQLASPVAAMGDSFGAALALRWKTSEPRIGSVVAISPYATLSNATLNICRENASWVPRSIIRAGLRELPSILNVEPGELDTITVLARHPVAALIITGENDRIAPVADVQRLFNEAAPGSEFFVVPRATHETVPYFFDDLVPPVLAWLNGKPEPNRAQK